MPALEFKFGLAVVEFWMEVFEGVENVLYSIPRSIPLSISEQLKKLAHESMKHLGKPIPDWHFGLLSTLLDARALTTNPKALHLSLQERREFEETIARVTTVLQGSFASKVRKCSSNYFAITANPSRLRGTDKNTITDTDDSSALLAGMEQGLPSDDELTAAPIATAMETREPDTSTRQRPSAIPAAAEEGTICPPLSPVSAQIPTRERELREILGAYSITQPSRLKGFMIRQFGILFVALMPMVL
ncbi:hypothetical protein V502_05857 [Pseudogymnoascus sp. VKM F-4520 (FW-2644)]|nr:hypothetical protein V502_05857 [Pseudogymnoascus sp. VKM F-4520 (FW-2644)]